MTSPANPANTARFELSASIRLFYLEAMLHLIVLLGLINLIPWPDLVLFGLLFLLLTLRFFQRQSVLRQYVSATSLEIRPASGRIIWREAGVEQDFPFEAAKIRMTRWFILLQLSEDTQRVDRLLLADSFHGPAQYSLCRRTLIELNLC